MKGDLWLRILRELERADPDAELVASRRKMFAAVSDDELIQAIVRMQRGEPDGLVLDGRLVDPRLQDMTDAEASAWLEDHKAELIAETRRSIANLNRRRAEAEAMGIRVR